MPEGGILHADAVIQKVIFELLQGLATFGRALDQLTDLIIDFFQPALPEQVFPFLKNARLFLGTQLFRQLFGQMPQILFG
jgi:hypothetical protein